MSAIRLNARVKEALEREARVALLGMVARFYHDVQPDPDATAIAIFSGGPFDGEGRTLSVARDIEIVAVPCRRIGPPALPTLFDLPTVALYRVIDRQHIGAYVRLSKDVLRPATFYATLLWFEEWG